MGIKIFLDISVILDSPSGGGIIYSVNFRKGSHKKKDFTDSSHKGTFEFLNYRIKFYNIGVDPKVTVTQWQYQPFTVNILFSHLLYIFCYNNILHIFN